MSAAVLQAELAAAREWIGQRLAAEAAGSTAPPQYVAIRPSSDAAFPTSNGKARPIPFAFGSYQPIDDLIDSKTPADPVELPCLSSGCCKSHCDQPSQPSDD